MSSSMWAPSNARELDAARQTPRKTPFAEQHAKARDQGFWAPDTPSGSGSGGRRSKSGPGRSRKPGGMDAPTPDRGGGRASGRGKPRGGPNSHQQFHQEPIAMTTTPIRQTASSAGFGRKSSKDREAIWQSIWGDDSDEEKPKGKAGEEKEQTKGKEAVPRGKEKESAGTDKDVEQLGDKLKTTELAAKAAPVSQPRPAPPAVVIPPPAVISGVDWSELDDDEDLTFLEQVPVPVASGIVSAGGRETSEREAITTSSSTPSVSTGLSTANLADEKACSATVADDPSSLDVTTASEIADSSHENPPKVNVGRRASASSSSPPKESQDGQATVDVKLAPQVPTPTSQREQAQTSMDIGSEGESGTPTTDSSRVGLKSPVESTRTTDGSDLKTSRWAVPNTRGMANPRGARGGARVPTSQGPFRQGPPVQRNQPFHNGPPRPIMPNGPRPPVAPANRVPPTGPRAMQTSQNQHRGSGSRNAPPLAAHQSAQQPNSAVPSTKRSDTSSPVPPSTTSGASSTTDSPSSTQSTNTLSQQQHQQQQQQRGPRQAPMPKDAAKRLMHGWIGTAPGGMRRGPSGRGRGRAPVGGGGQAVNTATSSKDATQ